jgi:hypothetical protein
MDMQQSFERSFLPIDRLIERQVLLGCLKQDLYIAWLEAGGPDSLPADPPQVKLWVGDSRSYAYISYFIPNVERAPVGFSEMVKKHIPSMDIITLTKNTVVTKTAIVKGLQFDAILPFSEYKNNITSKAPLGLPALVSKKIEAALRKANASITPKEVSVLLDNNLVVYAVAVFSEEIRPIFLAYFELAGFTVAWIAASEGFLLVSLKIPLNELVRA